MESDGGGLLEQLAGALGTSPDALRLLVSLLVGFPLAIFYRNSLYGRDARSQHCYFVACGFLVGFWNYGLDILHTTSALLLTYLVLRLLGRNSASVAASFVLNLGYLLYGYCTTATGDYDIKWTMPQCVLTLRLIGLAFDLSDGRQPEAQLSESQRRTALREMPSLLEVASYVYFPGSFLIGPQFGMRRFLDFVEGRLIERESGGALSPPDSLAPGLRRALLGFGYVAMYQLGTTYVSDQYMLDAERFQENGFLWRCVLLGVWGRCNLYKYISCWLITEGVCIAFGLAYNGRDERGVQRWNGLANVDLWTFENATEFNHYIASFNINTNHWCLEYVYKRLRFLGSKLYSQLATLLFLAVWHGVHSGYYLCFFQEFIIMYLEKDLKPVLLGHDKLQKLVSESFALRALVWLVLKFYTLVFMGYSLIPFVLLSYSRYLQVYKNVYFIGHVVFLSYPLLAPFIKRALRPRRQHAE